MSNILEHKKVGIVVKYEGEMVHFVFPEREALFPPRQMKRLARKMLDEAAKAERFIRENV
jgi:hypothetical protein